MLIAKLKSFKRRNKGVVFGLEFVLALLLFSLVAVSSEVKADNTKLYVSTRSVHYWDNEQYNNKNYGIILENNGLAVGIYKNSFGSWSGLGAFRLSTLYHNEGVSVNLNAGVAIGYPQSPIVATPALTIDYEFVRITVTPIVSNLSFKLVEF